MMMLVLIQDEGYIYISDDDVHDVSVMKYLS